MELKEAKNKFLNAWGTLGSSWGINRTMAQIHALLLVSDEELTTEQIMEELNISRGNANMNIRALMDWGLVHKKIRPGERKEFFMAEGDIWEIARLVARERRKRELLPALKILEEIKEMKDVTKEAKAFKSRINGVYDFAKMVDNLLERFIQNSNNWFLKIITAIRR